MASYSGILFTLSTFGHNKFTSVTLSLSAEHLYLEIYNIQQHLLTSLSLRIFLKDWFCSLMNYKDASRVTLKGHVFFKLDVIIMYFELINPNLN